MKRGNHGSASQRQTFITVSGNLNFSPVLITEWVGSFASPREKFLLCNGETCKDFPSNPLLSFLYPSSTSCGPPKAHEHIQTQPSDEVLKEKVTHAITGDPLPASCRWAEGPSAGQPPRGLRTHPGDSLL